MPYLRVADVPNSDDWVPISNTKGETVPRILIGAGAQVALPASGQGIAIGMMLQTQISYATINLWTGTTAAVSPTHQWAAICDTTGKVIAVSGDATTTAMAAGSQRSHFLTAAYVPTAPTPVYLVYVITATTMPTLVGSGAGAMNTTLNGMTPFITGVTATGLTTPPAVGSTMTLTASSRSPVYMALS